MYTIKPIKLVINYNINITKLVFIKDDNASKLNQS